MFRIHGDASRNAHQCNSSLHDPQLLTSRQVVCHILDRSCAHIVCTVVGRTFVERERNGGVVRSVGTHITGESTAGDGNRLCGLDTFFNLNTANHIAASNIQLNIIAARALRITYSNCLTSTCCLDVTAIHINSNALVRGMLGNNQRCAACRCSVSVCTGHGISTRRFNGTAIYIQHTCTNFNTSITLDTCSVVNISNAITSQIQRMTSNIDSAIYGNLVCVRSNSSVNGSAVVTGNLAVDSQFCPITIAPKTNSKHAASCPCALRCIDDHIILQR